MTTTTATMTTAAATLTTMAATAVASATAAVTTVATTARTTITTMTTVTGNGHLFTANQGDADQREENREAHNKRAIHLESSKVTQVPETTNFLPSS